MNQRDPQFRPDYGIEGPHDAGPWAVGALAIVWAKRTVIVVAIAFVAGVLGRHYGVF